VKSKRGCYLIYCFVSFVLMFVLTVLSVYCEQMYFDSLIQGDEVRDCWAYPESVPKAISLQLKICSLHDYKGCEGELRFAEYIMRNAGRLQTMSIRCNPYRQLGQRFEMLTELSLCTRRSASCKLIFR